MPPGTSSIERTAVALANKRLRSEILPLLPRQHPQPDLWNPLRYASTSEYGMTLDPSDALVLEIMKYDDLMDKTEAIVVESTKDAMLDDPEAFVKALFADLNL